MENASKALIMAGGVLISLLVISLGVYLFIDFGNSAKETHKIVKEKQIEQFNSQYTSYAGREDLTIHDVITVANMATQNNIYYELDKSSNRNKNGSYYIAVNLNNDKVKNILNSLGVSPTFSFNGEMEFGEEIYDDENIKKMFLEQNENLIRQHTRAIGERVGNDGFYISDGQIKCMPRIKCEQNGVVISNETKRVKSINYTVYTISGGY